MKNSSVIIKLIAFVIISFSFFNNIYAQIGFGTSSPDESAVLELSASNKGFLMPRLADPTVISNPATGLFVYNTTTSTVNYYDGSTWLELAPSTNLYAGDGLLLNAGVLSIGLDSSGSGLELTGTAPNKTLGIADGSITNVMLTGAITDNKLAMDYIQTTEVDNTSIEFVSNILSLKDNGVTASKIRDGNVTNAKLANSTITIGDETTNEAIGLGETLTFSGSGLATVTYDNTLNKFTISGSYSETDPIYASSPAAGITSTNITNWNTASNWGDHSTMGYLTSYTETDPIYAASPTAGITSTNITNWNTAYSWGDHSKMGYLTSYTETDHIYVASPAADITSTNITYWNTAYGWGDHSTMGYLTSYTETDGIIGNEVTNASANGGLTRTGAGTSIDPYTLGIATNGVTTDKILDGSVTNAKLSDNTITVISGDGLKNGGSVALGSSLTLDIDYVVGSGLKLISGQLAVDQNVIDQFVDNDIADNYVPFKDGGTNKLVASNIYYDGTNVGIGTTSMVAKLHVNGNIKTTNIHEDSDIRFKENIETITNALAKVLALRGVKFNWNENYANKHNIPKEKMLGLIAQEVEEIIPEVVVTDENGYKSVKYTNLIGLLIEALKDQSILINELRTSQNRQAAQIESLINLLNENGITK